MNPGLAPTCSLAGEPHFSVTEEQWGALVSQNLKRGTRGKISLPSNPLVIFKTPLYQKRRPTNSASHLNGHIRYERKGSFLMSVEGRVYERTKRDERVSLHMIRHPEGNARAKKAGGQSPKDPAGLASCLSGNRGSPPRSHALAVRRRDRPDRAAGSG